MSSRRLFSLLLTSLAIAAPQGAVLAEEATAPATASGAPAPIITLPDQIAWQGRPGRNRTAVLMGDPQKPGAFIQLLDWAPGIISRPHFHIHSRTFIVLKGHWDFGSGPHYDIATMKALPAGTVVTVPANGVLYDGCKQAPCMMAIIGEGQDPEFMVDEAGKTLPP